MPSIRPAIKNAVVLAFLALLTLEYFSGTPIPLFFTRLKQLLLAAAILWSAGSYGTQLLRWKHLDNPALTLFERFLFAETLGLGLLSLGMIVLGLLRGWVPTGAWALTAGGILLSRPFNKAIKELFASLTRESPVSSRALLPIAALAFAAAVTFLLALAPLTYYDSLVYHFALPAAYIKAHGWIGLPNLIYSAFPQTLEMLWTLGLLLGYDTVANLIAWSIGLLLLGATVAYAQRFLDLSVGWVAAALMALMPAFLMLSCGGYIDVGLTLFSFMALYAATLWTVQPLPGLLIQAGLFAGWAFGTKYTGALPALLIGFMLVGVIARREPTKQSGGATGLLRFARNDGFKTLLIYGGSAFLVSFPWLIKNMYYVGNPVFPFFYTWGLQAQNPWLNQGAAGYFMGITEYYSRSLWELPEVIWRTAVNGLDFGKGMDVLGDFGWITLFALLPLLWLCRKRPPIIKTLLAFCGLYFSFWAISRPVLRFLFPICPLLALLAAYAWVHSIREQPRAARWALRGVLGAFLLSGLFLFSYAMNLLSPFGVALGIDDPDAYLRRKVPYYGAAAFVNSQTPMDSRVYVFGDQRSYYYQRPVWVSPVFSTDPLTTWANQAPQARALRQKLKDEGITHLVVNRVEFHRLASYFYPRFTEQGRKNWKALMSVLKPIYHDRASDVYAL